MDKQLDRAFYLSLLLKAADSLLEIIGGLLALSLSPDRLNRLVSDLTQHELAKDPHDFFANHLLKVSHDFAHGGRYFAAIYLLSHGLIKIVVIVALLRHKLWAYPALIVVLGAFIIYQIYRLSYKFSVGLLLLTLFDVLVIGLTWLEYKKHSKTKPTAA